VRRLIEWELPEIDERHRRWVTLFFVVFAFTFPFTIMLPDVLGDVVTVGPGVIDPGLTTTELMERVRRRVLATERAEAAVFLELFPLLLSLLLTFAGVVVYRGYADYPRTLGRRVPLRAAVLMVGVNAATVVPFLLLLAVLGLAASAMGLPFERGWEAVRGLTVVGEQLVASIPRLVELPYPLPLIAAILTVELPLYWFHRLGHTWRPVWLLFHRPHHMPRELTIPMTPAVVVAFPLFFLITLPLTLAVGIGARLFHPETMIMEALLFRVVTQAVGIFSHNSAHYAPLRRSRFAMLLGHLTVGGPYHYVHHSALPQHACCNLTGGGCFFLFWDRVFGTFAEPPLDKPPVGLTGSAELYPNPLRLALAGVLQLLYELKHNRGLGQRLRIVLGPSSYDPPVTKDYTTAPQ